MVAIYDTRVYHITGTQSIRHGLWNRWADFHMIDQTSWLWGLHSKFTAYLAQISNTLVPPLHSYTHLVRKYFKSISVEMGVIPELGTKTCLVEGVSPSLAT